ncbi:MAG: hypothetical protein ISS19_04105 [Bacteroidales bacterium]|nr:hypothetical protein [Bacteroidales bacterium]
MATSSKSTKEDPNGGNSGPVTPKLKFWIDLAKWFIVSVALVVATKVIDTGLRNRTADLAELKFYDKYITELIVLNPDPVNKIMMAEYIICVSPSEKIRKRWKVYYDSIYPEYIEYITPIVEEKALLQQRYLSLSRSPGVTDANQDELARIEMRLGEIRDILFPKMKLPEKEYLENENKQQ